MTGIIGRKLGMTNVYDANNVRTPVTLIEAGPCAVMRVRTKDADGYDALQLGFGDKKKNKARKPEQGYVEKHKLPYRRTLREFRLVEAGEHKIGDEIKADIFNVGDRVKVVGTSKGKGFQGVMKRHGFGGVGGVTHGQSDRLRHPGSIGQSSDPSRVLKGTRMAGRTGGDRKTTRNLTIVDVAVEKNIIAVKGAVPGAVNGLVEIHKL
ncbi:MAG: 50S ribosomal protein L3 [Ignavibacteriales bacterium]|nr:50S ribosomal protein L3 [Ignavibacteriales bacterium]